MKKSLEIRQKKAAVIADMRAILDKADEEKRGLTEEEEKRYGDMEASLDGFDADIARYEKLEKQEEEMRTIRFPAPAIIIPGKTHDEKTFRNIGEYFHTLAANPSDARLMEMREQSMGTGSGGGFAIPEQFRADILQVQPQGSIVRGGGATVIPAGSPPDAKLTMPTLDQTSAQNVYGGVIITHTGEGVTMTETDAKLRETTVEPKEMSAYIVTTNKLLNNWDAASTFITMQLRKAMAGAEDYDFLRGNGVNKAMGIINSSAAIAYNRAGANAVAYADVYNMFARAKFGGSLQWIASQTILPQLVAMVDAGNHAVWIAGTGGTSAADTPPGTLMGLPLRFADRLPALGTKGDLVLADLSYYLIKDGSGPFAAISTELLFLSNKTVFKIVWNVDGKPWLTEPLPIEGSTSNTVSPFVVLN